MTLSTPSNPYLYRFEGKIPALKNGKEVYPDWKNKKIHMSSSPEVLKWYANQPRWLASDRKANEHLNKMVRPFCVLELYEYAAVYPLDADNVYTTVQELIQDPDPKEREKGLLAHVHDDKDVIHHAVYIYDLCQDMPQIGAFLWMWENTKDHPVQQQVEWLQHRSIERYKKQTFLPDWLA